MELKRVYWFVNQNQIIMSISDLFKDSVNWSEQELVALCKIMSIQSLVDGELSVEEAQVLGVILAEIPKKSGLTNVESVLKRAADMNADLALSVLQQMHSKKKKAVIAFLALLGVADGDLDINEQRFVELIGKALNVL